MSLSARRAWIEISTVTEYSSKWSVALRKESVDRNILSDRRHWQMGVALRKESVDRNGFCDLEPIRNAVALRKESVDRNLDIDYYKSRIHRRSPQGERG